MCPTYCGKSPVIANHAAFDPTKMWPAGRIEGSSISVAHGDVDEGAHHRIEQRAAAAAMRIMAGLVAMDQEVVAAFGDGEPVARDAGERLERIARDAAA